jgi:hypothetical protein
MAREFAPFRTARLDHLTADEGPSRDDDLVADDDVADDHEFQSIAFTRGFRRHGPERPHGDQGSVGQFRCKPARRRQEHRGSDGRRRQEIPEPA